MSRRAEYSRLGAPIEAERSKSKAILTLAALAVAFCLIAWLVWPAEQTAFQPLKAVAVLKGDSKVEGVIYFEQTKANGPVSITGKVENLDSIAKRGFHIHALGDLSGGCLSAGAHYNPFGQTHGAPNASVRHVGDLGNISTDKNGVAFLDLQDSQISLNGKLSILGRSVVVHAGTDDLGKGGNEESLKTGNAGARSACGVIGIAAS